jgi:hypothetical protein
VKQHNVPSFPPTSSVISSINPNGSEQTPAALEDWIDMDHTPAFVSGHGKSVQLKIGQGIRFNVTGEAHTATVDHIELDRVTFTLRSTPQTHSLRTGETGRYDVSGDGEPDISVVVNSIDSDIATISFAAIKSPRSDVAPTAKEVEPKKEALPTMLIVAVTLAIVGVVALSLVLKRRQSN